MEQQSRKRKLVREKVSDRTDEKYTADKIHTGIIQR